MTKAEVEELREKIAKQPTEIRQLLEKMLDELLKKGN